MGRCTQKQEGFPHYRLDSTIEIPRKFRDFARRRIGGLAQFSESHRSLIDLLANAYVLGLQDGIEAIGHQEKVATMQTNGSDHHDE